MSFKSFITKKVLQMRGVSADQADAIAQKLADNPEIAESLKALESNKEVKEGELPLVEKFNSEKELLTSNFITEGMFLTIPTIPA